MTVTFRRSRVRKAASKRRQKAGAQMSGLGHQAADMAGISRRGGKSPSEPGPEFFTPPSPEPYPLYTFIEDWNRGIIPSNGALLKFLETWSHSPILASDPRLSPAGSALVADLRELAYVLIRAIKERNKDELIQRFVGHLRLAGRIIRHGQRSGRITIVEDLPHRRRIKLFGRKDVQVRSEVKERARTIKQDASDMWGLVQLIFTSTDFRTAIVDIQKLTWRVLNQCPVGGRIFESTRRGHEGMERMYESREVGQTFRGNENRNENIHERIERTAREIRNLKGEPNRETDGVTQQRQPSIEIYEPKSRARTEMQSVSESKTMGEERQVREEQESQQQKFRTETWAEGKPMSPMTEDERTKELEELLDDMKSLFQRLAQNAEVRKAIVGIWTILTRWQQQASMLPGTVLPSDLTYDANFAAAQQDLLSLAERFAGGASIRPLLQSIQHFQQETTSDYELNDFFLDWRAFLTACTTDPEYMEHAEYRRRGRFLLERTNEYAEKKYRKLFQENLDSWNTFIRGWQNDKIAAKVGRIFSKILNEDLFASGSPQGAGLLRLGGIQTSLINDFRDVILPAMLRSLYELPLPHMEIEQGSMRVALDNVVLPAALFAPATLDFHTRSSLHVTPRERLLRGITRRQVSRPSSWRSGAHLSLSGMKGDIQNVRFALDRSTFPKVRDTGTCDVRLGGSGLNIALDMATDIDASARRFKIEPVYVRVKLDRLALRFYDVEHRNFFGLLRPYIQYIMKSRIERALCDRIVNTISFIDRTASRLARRSSSSPSLVQ